MTATVESTYALKPAVNADGLPVVPMTDDQKFEFDLRGWILLPGLFSEEELVPMREHLYKLRDNRDALPPEQRHMYGGPCQRLLDHPVLVGVLNEILSHQGLATEDCYGFRYDGSHFVIRSTDMDNFGPHGGGGLHNFAHSSHFYQHQKGKIFSGLTRVVWELNPVEKEDRGTLFLTGSHKTAFPIPQDVYKNRDHRFFENYACPAGSAIVFTESLCHSGDRWTNKDRERISTFTCYNTVNAKWHKAKLPLEVLHTMPPLRQSLFRGVWHGMGDVPGVNRYVDDENLAL
jgi:hypothetical protein